MPTTLDNHTVSLTKNGYQKLWHLIQDYPRSQILDHLGKYFPTPSQYRPQALKMLGGDEKKEVLPPVWDEVKTFGEQTIKALLAVSIVFSHKKLINLFSIKTNSRGEGTIERSDIGEKDYTNFAYALEELGIAVNFQQGQPKVNYSWQPISTLQDIGPLIKQVLQAQLMRMGWLAAGSKAIFETTFYEEIENYHFSKVFGLDDTAELREWLEGGESPRQLREKPATKPQAAPTGIYIPKTEPRTSVTPAQPLPLQTRMWKFSTFFSDLSGAFSDAAFRVNPWLQQRFVAGLLAKRFLILTGLSGSGKTKLAQAFAQWICGMESQIAIIPVGADWTSREPLLGYPNALKPGEYCRPDNGALDLILQAANPQNAGKPYFLILDEMNLSHVERYFADFLSAMESKEKIPLHANHQDWKDDTPASTALPPNLFIIGTVNIDETTYMFSPKVLDRANVIEFKVSHEAMAEFLRNPQPLTLDKLKGAGQAYAAGFVQVAKQQEITPDDPRQVESTLLDFYKELEPVGAEFAFRTAGEIKRFIGIVNLFSREGVEGIIPDNILDAAVLQKLLPRIHGSRLKVEPTLKALAGLCLPDKDQLPDHDGNFWKTLQGQKSRARYKLSLEKIGAMGQRLIQNGFTSYAEA